MKMYTLVATGDAASCLCRDIGVGDSMTRFGRLIQLVSGWVGAARIAGTCVGIAGALLGLCERQ